MDTVVKFVEIRFGNDTYVVTEKWGNALHDLTRNAADATAREFPNSEIMVDVSLVRVEQQTFISCIKEVRSLLGTSLKDSKELVDKVREGNTVSLGRYPLCKALKIRDIFQAAGGTVKIPSPLEILGSCANDG